MGGKIKCKCGNEILIYSDIVGRDFEINADGGKIEKGGQAACDVLEVREGGGKGLLQAGSRGEEIINILILFLFCKLPYRL